MPPFQIGEDGLVGGVWALSEAETFADFFDVGWCVLVHNGPLSFMAKAEHGAGTGERLVGEAGASLDRRLGEVEFPF
jgi:hypothetical protein